MYVLRNLTLNLDSQILSFALAHFSKLIQACTDFNAFEFGLRKIVLCNIINVLEVSNAVASLAHFVKAFFDEEFLVPSKRCLNKLLQGLTSFNCVVVHPDHHALSKVDHVLPRCLQFAKCHDVRLVPRDENLLHRTHHADFDLVEAQIARRLHLWFYVQ